MVGALAALAVVAMTLVMDVAHLYAARANLVMAADAAALAAAPVTFASFGTDGNPVHAASAMAAGNGAMLLECSCEIDRGWAPRRVVVTVGATVDLVLLGDRSLTAGAAAEFRPVDLGRGES